MNAYVSSPLNSVYYQYNNPYVYETNRGAQLSLLDSIQKERDNNLSKLTKLEIDKYKIEKENNYKLNELELNKSVTLIKSSEKLGELERNLDLANINKRRNSVELEAAISIHQNSP